MWHNLFCEPTPLFPYEPVNIPKNVFSICPAHRPRLQVCLPSGEKISNERERMQVLPPNNWTATGSLRQGRQFDNHTVAVPFHGLDFEINSIKRRWKKDGAVPRCLLELFSGDPTEVQTPKVFPRLLSHHLDQLDLIGEMLNISSCCANGCNLKRKPKDTLSFCQEPNKPLDPVTASISPGCVEHLGKSKEVQNQGEEEAKPTWREAPPRDHWHSLNH